MYCIKQLFYFKSLLIDMWSVQGPRGLEKMCQSTVLIVGPICDLKFMRYVLEICDLKK